MSQPVRQSVYSASPFAYQKGVLCCEGISLRTLAEEVGTPAYVYSGTRFDVAFLGIEEALAFAPSHWIAYAVKANSNLSILRRLGNLGAGADVVSYGELARALKAGIDPKKIVFSGVGKTDDELLFALQSNIRSIHAESAAEVSAIDVLAARLGIKAPISLRVNPDVNPQTHPYIATGLKEAKFGLDLDTARSVVSHILKNPHLQLEGIATHIGSQLSSVAPLREAVTIVAKFAMECRSLGAPIRTLDVGGGWPAHYGNEKAPLPLAQEFAQAIAQGLEQANVRPADFELVLELGRSIAAEAGALLTRVVYTKDNGHKKFAVVDAAMTELIRPALYSAYHAILPVAEMNTPQPDWQTYDVVGPVCESGDFLAKERLLPPMQRGDYLVLCGAGAYAAVMSSNYNSRPKAPEVLVEGSTYRVIRARQPVEDLWKDEEL